MFRGGPFLVGPASVQRSRATGISCARTDARVTPLGGIRFTERPGLVRGNMVSKWEKGREGTQASGGGGHRMVLRIPNSPAGVAER